ncbi:MAG: cyclase family protein [bacterium]|nr:cyclase family protein [bacterium]
MRCIDLTRSFGATAPVFPGDPPAILERIATIKEHGYTSHRIAASVHTGTHIDAPAHMLEGGKLLSDIGVERYFGRGVLVDARGMTTVTATALKNVELRRGDIVLVLTGWSAQYGSQRYFSDYPEISPSFAQRLADAQVSLVGMDTPGPDRPHYLVHKLLLSHNVLIIENLLHLEELLQTKEFEVAALPAHWEADAAPVRVVARIP